MLNAALQWLTSNLKLLGAFGAVLVFLVWEARRKSLEIEKLKLEIKALKRETIIYRPTKEEMDEVLETTYKLPTRRLGIMGSGHYLEDFADEFRRFALLLSAYYGDFRSRSQIAEMRLRAAMEHQPPPFPSAETQHPDPTRVVSLWKAARARASHDLTPEAVNAIDTFLARFPLRQRVA